LTVHGVLRQLAAALVVLAMWPGMAWASAPPERQAIVILVEDASFEQLMADPTVQALARDGGAGLVSTRVAPNDQGTGAYVTLGAGARAAGPALGNGPRDQRAELMMGQLEWVRDANAGGAIPGLLGAVLRGAGVSICIDSYGEGHPEGDHRLEELVTMDPGGSMPVGANPDCGLIVLRVDGPEDASASVSAWWALVSAPDLQVIVLSPQASRAMNASKDELTPIVMAEEGSAGDMFLASGPMHTLTSDTTQRTGVVSNEDIAPTILHFFGLPVPAEMKGQPIRVVDAPSPFELHGRYLAERRMYVPVDIAASVVLVVVMGFGFLVFFRREQMPSWALAAGRWACFAIPALGVALLAAGHLPTLAYAWVALLAAAITLLLPMIALAFRRRGPLAPPLVFGLLVLAFFVFEALTGWYGTMFTFLGSTALDGGRFYGLSNVETGLLLGSALFVAASPKPWKGFAVIVAVALFAGLPGLAANLGAAVTIFVGAGLWLALRRDGRFGWKEAGLTALTVVVGTAVVLAAHRFLAGTPTHGTRFVQAAGSDPLRAVSTALSRLEIGIRLLQYNPIGISYLVATPILVWVVTTRRGGLRAIFERCPHWRAAMLTILWASVAAYFVEDTGVAAVGLGFAMALGGTLYLPLALPGVPFAPGAGKMEAS